MVQTLHISCQRILEFIWRNTKITSLADAHYNGSNYISQEYWLSAEELELEGDWKVKWNNYIGVLTQGFIRLSEKRESLVWIYDKHLGQVTAPI